MNLKRGDDMLERPRCIGIFTATLDDEYQSSLWHAIEQEAKKRNLGTITFVGSGIGSPVASEASSNLAYQLASEQNIDGLIIIASSLGSYSTTMDLRTYFEPWANLSRVSIGMRFKGMSDVTVAGEEGIAALVEHLITVHGRRRFAILKGPETHEESIRRLHACKEVLASHDIVLDQRMVKAGTFVDEAGKQMVNYLLDGGFAFDALICLNDWMALGALNQLSKRGVKVPDDVSVVGFDGMESSRYTLPPLTTVVQPLYEMGKIAVDILDRIMAGGDQEHIVLPSSPVIRESCGCNPHVNYTPGLYEMPPYASVSERLAVQDLLQLVRNGDYHQMISRLNRAIDTTAKESGALHHWNEYLSVVEYKSRMESNLSSKTLTMLSGAARTLIGDKIGRYQAAKRLEVENSFNCLRAVSENLNGSFELQQLITNLKASLRLFGLQRGYLVGFENTITEARLMMTLHDEILPLEAYQKTFPTEDLLPPILAKQWKNERWVLLPLVYLHENLGYLLVPFGMVMPALYNILQEQVSSNLKGSLLLDQVRKSEKILEEQVALRTRDLLSEIKRRTELEREVMEISTKTMERIGQELHDDLCQYLLGISLLASSAEQHACTAQGVQKQELAQIREYLNKAIVKVKTISRGLMPIQSETHSFLQRLEALVGDTLRLVDIDIDVNVDPSFAIAEPIRELNLFRIVQEALTNAIKHSGASHIEISSQTEYDDSNRALHVLLVRDDGKGIDKSLHSQGLGMRIMHNRSVMADAELSFESSAEGTVVRIMLKE